MPFTPAHPAAVLPLLRSPLSPAALVCGAMAPDGPYFLASARIPVGAQSWYEPFLNATTSHSLAGLGVAVAYALALLALYALIRRPVADLLPSRFSRAGAAEPDGGGDAGGGGAKAGPGAVLRRAGWVLLSVLIGVLTHLAWDSFTHADGYAVTHLDFLRSTVAGELTVARLLQHLSTVGGLAAIAVHLWRRRARTTAGAETAAGDGAGLSPAVRRGVVAMLVAAVVAGAVAALGSLDEYRGGPAPQDRVPLQHVVEAVVSDAVKGAGAALACVLTLYACAWWAYRAARRAAPHQAPAPAR